MEKETVQGRLRRGLAPLLLASCCGAALALLLGTGNGTPDGQPRPQPPAVSDARSVTVMPAIVTTAVAAVVNTAPAFNADGALDTRIRRHLHLEAAPSVEAAAQQAAVVAGERPQETKATSVVNEPDRTDAQSATDLATTAPATDWSVLQGVMDTRIQALAALDRSADWLLLEGAVDTRISALQEVRAPWAPIPGRKPILSAGKGGGTPSRPAVVPRKDGEREMIVALIAEAERAEGIPEGLLLSVCTVESGPDLNRLLVAYHGKPYPARTVEEAVGQIERLRSQGKREADGGVCQRNVHHHAVPKGQPLSDVFDARKNVTWAARWLRALKENGTVDGETVAIPGERDWIQATAMFNAWLRFNVGARYAVRVDRVWRQIRLQRGIPKETYEAVMRESPAGARLLASAGGDRTGSRSRKPVTVAELPAED